MTHIPFYAEYISDISNETAIEHTPSLMARTSLLFVQRAGYILSNLNYKAKRQGYESYLLLYTIHGKGILKYKDLEYEISKGSLFLINCYEYHEYYTFDDSGWEFKYIHFNGAFCGNYCKLVWDAYGAVIPMIEANQVCFHLDALMNLKQEANMKFEVAASSIIVQLLTDILINAEGKSKGTTGNLANNKISSVLQYIEDNYANSISLTELAKVSYCSMHYLIKLFRKTVGYTPHEYIVKLRITKAKTVLTASDNSIDDIAHIVGFESTSNFIQTFKRNEGMTPTKYRSMFITGNTLGSWRCGSEQ